MPASSPLTPEEYCTIAAIETQAGRVIVSKIGLELKFALITIFILAACAPGGTGFSPERAATQDLIQNNQAIPESIRIHQALPWRESLMVFATYLSNDNNEKMSCEAVFEMQRSASGWRTIGSGIGCSVPPNSDAVTYSFGTQGVAGDELSYAHGLVRLDTAEEVEITWQDGAVQRVPVVNSSYLVLRDGSFQMIARVEVFDASDIEIYKIDILPDVRKIP